MSDSRVKEAKLALDSLIVYRNILNDDVLAEFYELLNSLHYSSDDLGQFISKYSRFYHKLMEENFSQKISFKEHIKRLILFDDNSFSKIAAHNSTENINSDMLSAVRNDFCCLQEISEIKADDIKSAAKIIYNKIPYAIVRINNLPQWDEALQYNKAASASEICDEMNNRPWQDCVNSISKYYFTSGSGVFAKYKSFIWDPVNVESGLKGIKDNDPVKFSDLIGYEAEREIVIENTLHFINGYQANNVLLYGDRGTGKSSTVKALLNEFADQGLRIIEVPKTYLSDFSKIIRLVKDRPNKFIFFVDDLAFEDSEENYTALKAILEGGLECRPKNVVIYATSNRRHLIKEKFSDRSGFGSGNSDDEVFSADTMQEKLSLADRFGIRVTFSSPDKKRYLAIVEGLASSRNLQVDKEILHNEALKWELWQNGRSPRTAKQFIDWYEAHISESRVKRYNI